MNNIINVRNLYKTYSTGSIKFEALKNINLTINKGEYVSIMGSS